MILVLPKKIINRLRKRLRGRFKEMGGVLVGQHVEADKFRVIDISFQKSGGSVSHFVRDPAQHKKFLDDFFARTGDDYSHFNYLGEWHSHPMFEPLPSGEDIRTMYDLVEDPAVGVNFLVLLIPRLKHRRLMELSATLIRSGVVPETVTLEFEDESDAGPGPDILRRIIRYFT
jgi:proteasome lid subunit RPN8/RPN11